LTAPGRNSPYTGALVDRLKAPREDLSAILIDVRNDVMRATKNQQVPWEHVALRARFYFTPPPAKGSDPAGPTSGQTGAVQPQASGAAEAWALVKDSAHVRALVAFRRQYGAGNPFYDHLAETRIEQLGQAAESARKKAAAEVEARERERLALLQKQQEAERQRAEAGRPGREFRDCTDVCPVMVGLPAGEFTMGWNDYDGENPQHSVKIAEPFAVGKFEVTFLEWEACVAGGGCKRYRTPSDRGWGKGRRPVIDVSWHDTKEYVAWLSRKTGKTYRLLSEAEWEYAARAGTTTRYAFGDTIGKKQARYQADNTAEVGSFPANKFGLHDMHGNVWEWVEDNWHPGYQGAPADGSVWPGGDVSQRVLRGGAWDSSPDVLRSAYRHRHLFILRASNVGFRVARTL
jgi:formylglycine-generating enzyme required for sulfatase activity